MQIVIKSITILSVGLTSACGNDGIIGKRDSGQALVSQCMRETGVSGAYSSPAGQKAPVVTPVTAQGGTQRGATVLNACVASKAAASGQSTAVQTSGASTVTTTSYGNVSAKTASRRQSTRRSSGVGNFCPQNAAVLYGGSRYCVGNR